ncbi:hypothetical protein A2U01_0087892, partial [Trifolium medium]|nr:hypothetical protein [Trifolium medium]
PDVEFCIEAEKIINSRPAA